MATAKKVTPKKETKKAVEKKAAKKLDFTAMTIVDLKKNIVEIKEEAVTLKRNMHLGDVQNVRAYKYKRRELARALTALNNKSKLEEK